MGAWKNAFFLQETLHAHESTRFKGGGYFGFVGEGGEVFMGAGLFLKKQDLPPGLTFSSENEIFKQECSKVSYGEFSGSRLKFSEICTWRE